MLLLWAHCNSNFCDDVPLKRIIIIWCITTWLVWCNHSLYCGATAGHRWQIYGAILWYFACDTLACRFDSETKTTCRISRQPRFESENAHWELVTRRLVGVGRGGGRGVPVLLTLISILYPEYEIALISK
jgi:hypothetical protein